MCDNDVIGFVIITTKNTLTTVNIGKTIFFFSVFAVNVIIQFLIRYSLSLIDHI